jgi:hypothetical protein
MGATTSQGKYMEIDSLIQELQSTFPQFTFTASEQACWSPQTRQVYYDARSSKQASIWSLLHELGHAVLDHKSYNTDIDLLQKEVAAWTEASAIAKKFSVDIDDDYAQNCLETYRNWLYKRSTCPQCGTHGIQNESRQYYCLNCKAQWSVSTSRFCRPYRGKTEREKSKKSQGDNAWLFVESNA